MQIVRIGILRQVLATETGDIMHRTWTLSCSFLTLLLAACASDGTSHDDDGGAATEPTTTNVTPENGGDISDPAGTVSLVVPAGALTEAVEVTLSVEARTAETATPIYRFSPEATSFSIAATLRVSTEGAPVDRELTLSQFGDGVWIPVGDAIAQSGTIEAPVGTLGAFTIISAEPAPEGPCEASCMAQPGAMCCTTCGCETQVPCQPVCGAGTRWDCELGCCFDSTAFGCVE